MLADVVRKPGRMAPAASLSELRQRQAAARKRREYLHSLASSAASKRARWLVQCRHLRLFMTDPACEAMRLRRNETPYQERHRSLIRVLKCTRHDKPELPA